MNLSSWYYANNREKHVRQIVIKLSPDSRTAPRVDNLTADSAFSVPNWAVTVVLGSPSPTPIIFAKATGAIEMVDHKPADVAFAFYHLRHGGVFQIFVQVDSPAVRSKFGYPFLAEHARWLDETNDRRIIEALIAGEEIELCFVAPGEKGPCTPFFSLVGNVPTDCRAKLKQEWDELRTHHNSVEFRDFQSALQQYNQENPMEELPVLPPTELERPPEVPEKQDQELSPETLGAIFQALSSNDVKEGDLLEIKRDGTVEVDQGGLGLTDYDIVELYNHGIRKVGDIEARHRYQRGLDNADRQNWKEAAKDFAAAVELDRTSPTYLYSLAVARTQSAPNDVGQEELQKYYLDVCAIFEKAITLDTNRSELDKEAYKKVAYTCGALYRSLKQHEDALRLFKVGLKHHSHDAELLAGISWSQFDLGQIADAEKTVARLLELAPDSDDGPKLWKAIRKAQGRDLTSDLSEALKRQIYKEFLEKQNQAFVQEYMDSGVSGKLSFEELVSDISGKSADAESKVRRFLLEKYGLKEFEFDLILKQGEREAWN